jgi:hypothetical protein
MKLIFKTILFILFSLPAFAQQENNLLLQKNYEKELENVKLQLQQLGYSSMSAEMQENLLSEIKNEEVKIKTSCFAFVGFDENGKYLTLSKNKFQEIQNFKNEISFDTKIDPTFFALSIDPLAEKFPSESPYSSMGNDAVNKIDPDGKKVELTGMRVAELSQQEPVRIPRLVADLEAITGLDLTVTAVQAGTMRGSDGSEVPRYRYFLTYAAPTGTESGSETARNFLMQAIDSEENIDMTYDHNIRGSRASRGGALMRAIPESLRDDVFHLTPEQIDQFVRGTSKDLDNRTFGWGMVFLHELGHRFLGLSDPSEEKRSTKPGENVELMNKIRREMGKNWGERQVYGSYVVNGNVYMAFTPEALEELRNGRVPGKGVVKLR